MLKEILFKAFYIRSLCKTLHEDQASYKNNINAERNFINAFIYQIIMQGLHEDQASYKDQYKC